MGPPITPRLSTNSPRWTPLHARVQRSLHARHLLPKGQKLLIAVSGGQDSVCLTQLLCDLQPKWQWELAIAHCDHQWPEDVGCADFVQTWLSQLNQPFHILTAHNDLAHTEAAARHWRYQALSELAMTCHASILVTGHTQSDRAETLLYNLIRGSGTDGLQALQWQRSFSPELAIVRPLLNVTRTETAEFCRELGLPIWDDPANHDRRFARNRLRHDVIPYVQTHLNPNVETALAQTAELLHADVEYLEQQAREHLAAIQHPDRPGLNRIVLRSLAIALQRRIIRQFLQIHLPTAPTFEQIEKLRSLIAAPNRTQTDPFPGGAIAAVEATWIWLMQSAP